MSENVYVIADIAGRFDELMLLIGKFKAPYKIISVGDICDRGPKSRQVFEFFMNNPQHVVIKGNHEVMMLQYYRDPGRSSTDSIWHWNGGDATEASFGWNVPENVLAWTNDLPADYELNLDGKLYLITHAPVPNPDHPWGEEPQRFWNRHSPLRNPKYELQIYGHNSRHNWISDNDGCYAVCIDDCKNKQLAAIELPSQRMIYQEYLG